MKNEQLTISFLIVVRHAALALTSRIAEVQHYVDEVIVVHDGDCEDETFMVASELADNALMAPFEGYCEPQRQRGLELCSGDWVLVGDSDEKFNINFLGAMYQWAQHAEADGCDAIMLSRHEVALGTDISKHPRFFKREGASFSDIIHTNVTVGGSGRVMDIPGVHFSHYSVTDGLKGSAEALTEKRLRYAAIQEKLREKYADCPDILKIHLSVDYGVHVSPWWSERGDQDCANSG